MLENNYSMTTIVMILSLCLLFFTTIRHYTKNSLLPTEAWILISGILYGVLSRYTEVKWLPLIGLSPEIVFFFLLPLLIFGSGRLVNTGILKYEAVPIGFYAVIGVIVTAFVIGIPLSHVLNIPVLHGLLLGTAVAATDPVAVGSIFQRFQMPEKLTTIVEGESLFNDGTTVVLFHLISSLTLSSAVLNLTHTGLSFVWSLAGAALLGIATGWVLSKILKIWHDNHMFFPVTLSLVLAFSTYLLAEDIFHVSGVVAVLIAAIIFAQKLHLRGEDEQISESKKIFGSFWDYISILANSVLFFALGVETGAHPFNVTFFR